MFNPGQIWGIVDRTFFKIYSKLYRLLIGWLAHCFSIVTSLRCYQCYSDTSWDHCKKRVKVVDCPQTHDEACSKIFYDHELHDRKTYTKFCEKTSQCTNESNPVCKAAKAHGAQCEVHCCTYDLCNAGSATTISGVLLVTCALVLVFYQAPQDTRRGSIEP